MYLLQVLALGLDIILLLLHYYTITTFGLAHYLNLSLFIISL